MPPKHTRNHSSNHSSESYLPYIYRYFRKHDFCQLLSAVVNCCQLLISKDPGERGLVYFDGARYTLF